MKASISDVAVLLRNGKAVKQSAESGGLPITRIETIADWAVNEEKVGFADLRRENCEDWLLKNGDILISHINSTKHLGKCAIYEGKPSELVHGMNLLVLRVNHMLADSRFMYRILAAPGFRRQLPKITKDSVNQSSFNISSFKKLQIPLPPLAEQKRIAAILDAADALRAKRRETLAQLDTLLQSTFLDMFGDPVTNPKGWKTKKGSEICKRITVGIVVKPASYYQETGIPALRSLNVRANKIEKNNLVYISNEDNENKLKKTRIKKGDILLVRSGQPGTAAVVPGNMEGFNAIDLLIATPNLSVVHPLYLCNYFNSSGGKRMALGAQRGQIQKHLNVGALKDALIPLPPLPLQRRFATIVESVEQQKTRLRAHLAELDTLFASLQHRAFKGAL